MLCIFDCVFVCARFLFSIASVIVSKFNPALGSFFSVIAFGSFTFCISVSNPVQSAARFAL